jgi:hypothetical protein
MTTDELVAYYQNLLIKQYQQPKARAHIAALVTEVIASQLPLQAIDAFDLTTAYGKQLDVLGKYLGVYRQVNGFTFGRTYFDLETYSDTPGSQKGFYVYGAAQPFLNYFEQYATNANVYNMTDDEMSYIIQLKVVVNSMNETLSNIDGMVQSFFKVDGSAILAVVDNLDMTINYDFSGAIQIKHRLAAYLNCLPAPAGVTLVVTGLTA